MTQQDERKILKKIRGIIVFFMIALALSGITAFPIETELNTFFSVTDINSESVNDYPEIFKFLHYIKENVTETNLKAPQLAYGCDWLAFAHLVIALLFIGPYRDPVRNKWVIQWGMIACASILPLAFICGPIRQIPFYWRLIDCSFGVFGIIPLLLCMKYIKALEKGI